MKKFLILISAVAVVALSGCNKDGVVPSTTKKVMTLSAKLHQAGSKADIDSQWKYQLSDGDKIIVTNSESPTSFEEFEKSGSSFTGYVTPTGSTASWYAFFAGNMGAESIQLTSQSGSQGDLANLFCWAGKQSDVDPEATELTMGLDPYTAVIQIESQRSEINIRAKNTSGYVKGMSVKVPADASGTPSFNVDYVDGAIDLIETSLQTSYIVVPAGVAFDIYDGDMKLKEITDSKIEAGRRYTLSVLPKTISASTTEVTLDGSMSAAGKEVTVTSGGAWTANASALWSISPENGVAGATKVTITPKQDGGSSVATLDALVFSLTGTDEKATVAVYQNIKVAEQTLYSYTMSESNNEAKEYSESNGGTMYLSKADYCSQFTSTYGYKLDGDAASSNTKYAIVTLKSDESLQVGDVITLKATTNGTASGSDYGCVLSSDRNGSNPHNLYVAKNTTKGTFVNLSYTVVASDGLQDATSFYITRCAGKTTYLNSVTITRGQ